MKQITENNYEIIPFDELTNVRFYTSRDPGSIVTPHWHDAVEIVLLQEGELYYTREDQTEKIQPGNLILTSPNIIHSTFCSHPNQAIVFQIPLSFLEKYVPNARLLHFAVPGFLEDSIVRTKVEQLTLTLEKMQGIIDIKPEGAILKFNSLLFDVLFQLTHNFTVEQTKAEITSREKNLDKLKHVLRYTKDHYNEPISLDEAAEIAMYETKYFCRFFKQNLGCTFLEYQNKLRISKIYDDLLNTKDPVQEILDRHGFTNYKLFRRTFKEQFHMTPSEVRRQQT